MNAPSSLAYELEERSNGWCFRFPANDTAAQWRGPHTDRAAAETAAMKAIEEHLAQDILAAFNLK